jgi:hypothetical protein
MLILLSSFIEPICSQTGLHLISRLRDDAVLYYLYTGAATGKAGRPREFAGKIYISENGFRILIFQKQGKSNIS